MAKDTSDDRTLGVLAHILMLVGGFIAPLIIYLVKKDSKGLAYENARNALNFSISMIIYSVVSMILMFVLIGFVLMIALGIFSFVCIIIGTVKASSGEVYKYPLTIQFIRS